MTNQVNKTTIEKPENGNRDFVTAYCSPEFKAEFELVAKKKGYQTVSEALRGLMRNFIETAGQSQVKTT